MEKVTPQMRAFFERYVEELKKPAERIATNKVEATLLENQHSRFTVRGHTLDQDEPDYAFGTGKGPTPTDYFVASVALGENVLVMRYAALNGVSIESLETTATGVWDVKGMYGVGRAVPAYKDITVETKVESRSPAGEVAKVVRLAHKRSPIHATLRKSTRLVFRLMVNGKAVRL